ncbi:hypothetical protein D3C87_1577790 [compost metagenome]
MMNRELVLRFCAFQQFSTEEYRRYPSLDSYLVEFTKRIDGRSDIGATFTDNELLRIGSEFDLAMTNASALLEKAAFRRYSPNQTKRGPINRAVFESQAVALSRYELTQLLPYKSEITQAFRRLFEDDEYSRAVTVGTGDPRRVEVRLDRTAAALREIIK